MAPGMSQTSSHASGLPLLARRRQIHRVLTLLSLPATNTLWHFNDWQMLGVYVGPVIGRAQSNRLIFRSRSDDP